MGKTFKSDIPATSQPATCKVKDGFSGKVCGESVVAYLQTTINVMDKDVPVKVGVCQRHYDLMEPNLKVSLGE